MSGLASPPAWAWALTGLDAGSKLCLLTMLTWDAYDNEGEIFVFPRRSSIAMRSGQTESAVKKQVAKLTKAKHIARAVRTVKGVSRQGWVITPGTTGADTGDHRGRDPHRVRGPQGSTPAPTVPDAGDHRGRHRGPQGPHTLQHSFSDPELNVVEARDPHDPKPDKIAAARRTPGPVDPWPSRVREASESAAYFLDQTSDSTNSGSYSQLLRQARANHGDERVLEAMRIHEADEPEHRQGRPPAGKLWHSRYSSWVEGVLGIEAPARASANTMLGSEADNLLVGNWTVHR